MNRRTFAAVVAGLVVAPLLAACGTSTRSIVVYNAQHEELIQAVAKGFTKQTGIKVELRNGKDLELAQQLVAEGKESPADVFLTENSPAMRVVDHAGLFAPLAAATLADIPAQYRPASGDWTGFAGRSTVLVYNPSLIKPAALPTSIMDLADPQWKGKITFAPTGADFQAIVAAVLAIEGEAKTKAWLAGIKANAASLSGNNIVAMQAVNDGEAQVGVIFHYYWYRDQAEAGDRSNNTKLHFFGNRDAGAFVSTSGAGVLGTSKHRADAQKFVAYLTSVAGQKTIADSYAMEYPLNPKVTFAKGVQPLDSLAPPTVRTDDLDPQKVVELMQDVGLL